MGANIKQSIVALLIMLAFSVCFLSVQQAIAQADQASLKLQAANVAVDQAFNGVLDAEKAGANVTDLLTQINTAQSILAQAENSYRTGDINSAVTQADSVLPLAQQVTAFAQTAKQTATINKQNASNATIVFTVIGSVIFILVLFQVWRIFKKRYIKNLSESRPEVVNQ